MVRAAFISILVAFIYVGGSVGVDGPVTGYVFVNAVCLFWLIYGAMWALEKFGAAIASRIMNRAPRG